MVELEPGARGAPVAILAHKGALAAIPLLDRALDLGRDVARVRGHVRAPGTRPAGRGELTALELADEGIEGAVEHLGDLAGGDLVTEQGLGIAQLVVGGLADGELEGIALRGDRGDPGGRANLPRGKFTVAGSNWPRGKFTRLSFPVTWPKVFAAPWGTSSVATSAVASISPWMIVPAAMSWMGVTNCVLAACWVCCVFCCRLLR